MNNEKLKEYYNKRIIPSGYNIPDFFIGEKIRQKNKYKTLKN